MACRQDFRGHVVETGLARRRATLAFMHGCALGGKLKRPRQWDVDSTEPSVSQSRCARRLLLVLPRRQLHRRQHRQHFLISKLPCHTSCNDVRSTCLEFILSYVVGVGTSSRRCERARRALREDTSSDSGDPTPLRRRCIENSIECTVRLRHMCRPRAC
jgi:hypothetical protein